MKRQFKITGIIFIALFALIYFFSNHIAGPLAAWNSQQAWKEYKNNIIITRGSTEEIEKIIDENLNGESDLNPEIALESIIELYNNTKNGVVESKASPIEIYVVYGTDHWDENSETFEIAFAHQKVDQDNGNLYEYRIDMIYDPADFKDIAEFGVYYDSNSGTEEFKNSVRESIGFQKARKNTPKKVEIIKEQI